MPPIGARLAGFAHASPRAGRRSRGATFQDLPWRCRRPSSSTDPRAVGETSFPTVARRCGLGDGGGIPRPETRISWKLSARPRCPDARLGALGNQRPFELRDRAKDLERKHALGRPSVDGVAQRAKVGAVLLQALDDVEEMADRAVEAVEADDDENVAGPDLPHQSCEL